MGTNRYTRTSTSSFNPLSLQEIMMVPLARQQQHEGQQAKLEELGIFDVNRLDPDDEFISGQIGDFKGKVTGIEDELMSKGVNRGLTKKLLNLKREREKFLSNEGAGGKAQNAYNAYQANVRDVMSNSKLDSTQRQLGLQWALDNYKGVEKGGTYNPYIGADYVELQEEFNKIASKMKPEKIAELTGWYQSKDKKRWLQNGKTTEQLPFEDIYKVLVASGMSNRKIQNYLADAERIGMINDPSQEIDRAARISAETFDVNNRPSVTRNMKFAPKESNGDDSGLGNYGNYNYVLPPINKNHVPRKEYESVIDHILAGDTRGKEQVISTSGNPLTGYSTRTVSEEGDPWALNDLPEEVRTRFQDIANDLAKKNLVPNTNLTDPKTLEAVNEYDKTFQPEINRIGIISDFSGNIGKYSTGIDSKDYNAVMRAVRNTKHRAIYKHPTSGKNYTWDKLQDKLNIEDIADVEGYVDADNGLPDTDNPKSDIKAEWVSPQVVSLKDKDGAVISGWYKTRDDSELNSPRYRADVDLNRSVFSKVKNRPLRPQEVRLMGTDVEMTYYPEKQALEMVNNHQGRNENADGKTKLEFKSIITAINGAGDRQGIYEVRKPDGSVMYVTKENIQSSTYAQREIDF